MSKRVVITGAAGGIGTEVTRLLRARGARVIGLDLDPADPDGIACDVRDQEAVDRAVAEAIERLGGLDILINNAGLGDPQSAGLAPDAKALAVLDVNLIAPWRVTSAALPTLRASHGRVINIASGLAYMAVPFAPAYCMSKRGLVAYSDALRLEHGDAITVTTVYPGYIRTKIHEASKALGFGLEGMVPPETVGAAAKVIVRAALDRPVRDVATTPIGGAGYVLARHSPRRVMDAVITRRVKHFARKGNFSESPLARDYVQRMSG